MQELRFGRNDAPVSHHRLHDAGGNGVAVLFEAKDGEFWLEVADDGVGFEEDKLGSSRTFGLLGMREGLLGMRKWQLI